ncbi:hypothetical protein C4573_01920 [Candidatus Woesearchaeota archaeon]|nr:MAG: hypothetical protein C4573_01920 [Candidatus Woesearchaeota archaeon]
MGFVRTILPYLAVGFISAPAYATFYVPDTLEQTTVSEKKIIDNIIEQELKKTTPVKKRPHEILRERKKYASLDVPIETAQVEDAVKGAVIDSIPTEPWNRIKQNGPFDGNDYSKKGRFNTGIGLHYLYSNTNALDGASVNIAPGVFLWDRIRLSGDVGFNNTDHNPGEDSWKLGASVSGHIPLGNRVNFVTGIDAGKYLIEKGRSKSYMGLRQGLEFFLSYGGGVQTLSFDVFGESNGIGFRVMHTFYGLQ